jgi:hypothetical protein
MDSFLALLTDCPMDVDRTHGGLTFAGRFTDAFFNDAKVIGGTGAGLEALQRKRT